MTIWLLTLVLLASLAGVGYRQGAVRVAFSLVGILVGAVLAKPLGKLLRPVLAAVGVKYPVLEWVLGALVVFVAISIIFKVVAFTVHQKVDVYYKYHAGDLRLALWERLNRRLGLCLALLNGTLYCILIAAVIYPFSYWSFQLATPGRDPKSLVILNRLGKDLESTGFAKVAGALNPMPKVWYEAADLAGLLYNNPLAEGRLEHYPAFLDLAERPEFQAIGGNTQFTEMRQRRMPIMELINQPQIQAILTTPDLLRQIWNTVVPDMKDLMAYMHTGKSAKYGRETILGRWNFDPRVALTLYLRTKPNISSREMQKLRAWYETAFSKTLFEAKPDHQALFKNLPPMGSPAPVAGAAPLPESLQGKWTNLDGSYQIAVSIGGKDMYLSAIVQADRLTITGNGMNLVFTHEE